MEKEESFISRAKFFTRECDQHGKRSMLDQDGGASENQTLAQSAMKSRLAISSLSRFTWLFEGYLYNAGGKEGSVNRAQNAKVARFTPITPFAPLNWRCAPNEKYNITTKRE